MKKADDSGPGHWDFIESGDCDWPEATLEENVYFREIAAAYLRATFPLPAGYIIDVLEAQYDQSRFPVIALGWDEWPDVTDNEHRELIRRMVWPLHRFIKAVDWEEVSRIHNDSKRAPDVRDLEKLLERAAHPLTLRCLELLADPATIIHLASEPKDAAKFYAIHSMPARVEEKLGHQSNEPFLPALKRMADAGEAVCGHNVTRASERFFILTDMSLQKLVVIEAMNDDISNKLQKIYYETE